MKISCRFTRVLECILEEQAATFNEPDEERQFAGMAAESLVRLCNELELKLNVAWPQSEATGGRDAWVGYLGIFVGFAVGVRTASLLDSISTPISIGAGVILGGIAWVASTRWVFAPAFVRTQKVSTTETLWELYERIVRPHVAEYLRTHQLTLGQLAEAATAQPHANAKFGQAPFTELLRNGMPLAFHSLGLRLATN